MDPATTSALPLAHTALVRSGLWFQALPSALQEQLLAMATLRALDGGQRLFGRGDAPDGLYCVVEGTLRITGIAGNGKEALLAMVEAPHWFGEISLFDGLPRTHDAWAEGPAVLLHLRQDRLLALLAGQPAWWRELALLMTQKLRLSFRMIEETASLPAAQRLARRLVTIAEGYGDYQGASRREIRMPQEQLALMLALSRQTVNQILRQFAADGAIRLGRGGIEILDIARLRALAA
ncbi:Crp/Fnr family transcriptional regulator [Oxalobacteraceae bacterium]|nr:Crp/Fnr family transcriptional regulator [Oxalobacteraceae bacterium]